MTTAPALEVDQGTTLVREFTWTAGGVPVDLRGATMHMQFRSAPSLLGTVHLDLAVGTGLEITSAVDGEFKMTITAAQTALLPAKTIYSDCLVTFADTTKLRILQRDVIVSAQRST